MAVLTRSRVCKQVSVKCACLQSLLKHLIAQVRMHRNLYPFYSNASGRQCPHPCVCILALQNEDSLCESGLQNKNHVHVAALLSSMENRDITSVHFLGSIRGVSPAKTRSIISKLATAFSTTLF